jgi:iron complex outermembrane receptor protein
MKMNINYKPLRVWLLLLMTWLALPALAQQNVSGRVVDENGDPLPGVNIVIVGTASGTSTDIDGKYQVSVPNGEAVLRFSYIGYVSQDVAVGTQSVIDVQLQLDAETLDEVVVIGYGETKKEDLTGSVTAISAKEFNKGAMVSPQDLIVGRTAGVQVTTGGGAPGAGASIRIRGGSSLSASNAPLIVIDGTPIDTEGIAGMANPLSAINPNDIESMTVLKDASATAIYGSRASNGVIIITTKRGRAGAPIQVGYSANVSMYQVGETLPVMSAAEYRTLVQRLVDEGVVLERAVETLGEASTNWQDEIFSNAFGTEHNVNISGSAGSMPFRASYGFSNQNGILETSSFRRHSVAIGIDPTLLGDKLKISANAKFANSRSRFADQGAIDGAISYDPTQPVRDASSIFGGYSYWMDQANTEGIRPRLGLSPSNPVALLHQRNNTADVNRFIGNLQFTYKLPVEGLTATLNGGIDYSSSDGEDKTYQNAAHAYQAPGTLGILDGVEMELPLAYRGGGRNIYSEDKRNELLQFTLNYNRKLGFAKSELSLMGGYEWQRFYRESSSNSNNFTGTSLTPFSDAFSTENYLVSFFGRLNYGLADGRYMFTVTLRNDGSSRFVGDNQWGLFPSAAFAWKINEEAFLKNVEVLTQLKFRAGYGVTGQQNIGFGDYPALARIRFSEPQAQYLGVSTARIEGYNANLRWEETTTLNFGLDFGFLQQRLSGTIDWYQRTTDDLINVIPVPAGTNFINQIATNIGSLENTGLEIGLNAILIDKDDFTLDFGVNFSRNRNEITKLTLVDDPNYIGVQLGGINGATGNSVQLHRVGNTASSFFVYEQVYDNNGDPIQGTYVDQNGDGVINDDDRLIYKNPVPEYYMGYSLRVNYKNLSVAMNARLTMGNYVYNNVASLRGQYQNVFHPNGFLQNVISSSEETQFSTPQFLSNYYIQDASFFRMDNITVGYRFDKLLLGKYDLNLSLTGQNVFRITPYSGLDPEIDGGIDNNVYPRPRTILFGLNVNF